LSNLGLPIYMQLLNNGGARWSDVTFEDTRILKSEFHTPARTKIWTENSVVVPDMDGSPGWATRVSPNSLETHLVRQWGNIGHQRAVGQG